MKIDKLVVLVEKLTKSKKNSIEKLNWAINLIEQDAPKEVKKETQKIRKWIENAWDTIRIHAYRLKIGVPKRTTYYNPEDDLEKIKEFKKSFNSFLKSVEGS